MKNSSPAPLGEFLGNERLISWLEQSLAGEKLPHALLILGEPGCGKNKLARLLSSALLNDSNNLVARGAHPDYLLLKGEGKANNITVESVRDASFELRHSPVLAERRAVHIQEAGNLNASSAAALLKTLEEPPDGVFFILTAARQSELIETINSRCVGVYVEPLSSELCLSEALKRTPGASETAAAFLAEFYGGRLGLVLAALRDEFYLGCARDAKRFIDLLLECNKLEALALIDHYCEKPAANLKIFIQNAALAAQNALYLGAAPETVAAIVAALDSHIPKIERNVAPRLLATSLVATAIGEAETFLAD